MNKLSRRSFLKTTSLGMTFMATQMYSQGFSNLLLKDAKFEKIKLDYVIFDKGIKQSEEFALKMKALGTKVFEVDKDISSMWSEIINPTWGKEKDTAIVGLTSYETMFVLQKIAFDKNMVLYYSAQHDFNEKNIKHKINTSKTVLENIEKNLKYYSWSDTLALNLNNYPYEKIKVKDEIQTEYEDNDKKNIVLYSWIMAPRKIAC